MSDIRQYLLDHDKNKKEATAVAQQSAARKWPCSAIRVRKLELIAGQGCKPTS